MLESSAEMKLAAKQWTEKIKEDLSLQWEDCMKGIG